MSRQTRRLMNIRSQSAKAKSGDDDFVAVAIMRDVKITASAKKYLSEVPFDFFKNDQGTSPSGKIGMTDAKKILERWNEQREAAQNEISEAANLIGKEK